MRSRGMDPAVVVVASIAIAAGCYSPRIEDGTLACTTEKVCPHGFTCGGDGRCYSSAPIDAAMDQRVFEAGTEGGSAGAGGSVGGIGGSAGTGRGRGAGGGSGTTGSAGAGAGGRGGTIG